MTDMTRAIMSLIKSTSYLLGVKMSDDDMKRYGEFIGIIVKYKEDPEFTSKISQTIDDLIVQVKAYEDMKRQVGEKTQ